MKIDKITKARAKVSMKHVFWGMHLMRLKVEVDESRPTGSTNGVFLKYNPTWFNALTPPQQEYFLIHEVLHIVLKHHLRRGQRDPKWWNIACDFAINNWLNESGFIMPEKGLANPIFANMSAESIYDKLISDFKQIIGTDYAISETNPDIGKDDAQGGDSDRDSDNDSGTDQSQDDSGSGDHPEKDDGKNQNQGSGLGSPPYPDPKYGDVEDMAPNMSGSEIQDAAAKIDVFTAQALQQAQSIGKMPGNLKTLIERILEPRIDWESHLRRWLGGDVYDNYSYRRPNRKYMQWDPPLYLPSIEKVGIGDVVIGIDTSGSVSEQESERFFAEINHISKEYKCNSIYIIYCDTEIRHVQCEPGGIEVEKLEWEGGGGTRVTPVFQFIEDHPEIEITNFIYFSDLHVNDFPENPPEYPVLWATTGSKHAPWGEVLPIDLGD